MKLQPSYLLHETCDIVNFIVDDEPRVFDHVMGLNLLACVVFHTALLRCECVFILHVLTLTFFPHLHSLSVASVLNSVETSAQVLPVIFQLEAVFLVLLLLHPTRLVQFQSSRHTISTSPPVTRNDRIHSLEPNQPISAEFTLHTASDVSNSSQSESRAEHRETAKRHTHVISTLASRYTTLKVLNTEKS